MNSTYKDKKNTQIEEVKVNGWIKNKISDIRESVHGKQYRVVSVEVVEANDKNEKRIIVDNDVVFFTFWLDKFDEITKNKIETFTEGNSIYATGFFSANNNNNKTLFFNVTKLNR